ncbi:class I SAM-dependent methyltransferase [Chondromyces crocatus]|uniref:Methyltransferase UbiE n=1 Tax=Chondromyces crocatus TaxID=52 RepID=A0A0K1EK28_CHOCO|nr:class I SAM-dependent methyltransferase [Chondromyces crocatus]AKT41209.1 methyltransferase UbiE [Chondromyces crocatus]
MNDRHDMYAGIGDDYDRTFALLPYREHVEAYSLFRRLGALSGQSVLDLACGTGIFTRALRRWGAARVVGADASEDMVRVAREHEARQPLGIAVVVQDAAQLGDLGAFDCVVAVYLLGYARTRDELFQMARGAFDGLVPGGRLVTYFVNPDLSRIPGYYRKYGIDFFVGPDVRDGDPIDFVLHLGPDATPKLTNHLWSRDTVASVFERAGFTSLRWHLPELSPEGLALHGEAFWADYQDKWPGIFLECRRPIPRT